MGTVGVHHPSYGSRIRLTDTVPYGLLKGLDTVRVAVRKMPYDYHMKDGQFGRMYGFLIR
jgi:hypothetical protein